MCTWTTADLAVELARFLFEGALGIAVCILVQRVKATREDRDYWSARYAREAAEFTAHLQACPRSWYAPGRMQ